MSRHFRRNLVIVKLIIFVFVREYKVGGLHSLGQSQSPLPCGSSAPPQPTGRSGGYFPDTH